MFTNRNEVFTFRNLNIHALPFQLPEPIPQVDREASAKLGEMKSELQKKNTQIKELEEKCENLEKKLNEQQDTILKLEEKLAETQERNNRLCDVLVEKIGEWQHCLHVF